MFAELAGKRVRASPYTAGSPAPRATGLPRPPSSPRRVEVVERNDADLAVVGAGSAGLTAARLAAWFGKRVVLIAKQRLGGDGLRYGGAPSRALIKASRAAHESRTADRWELELHDVRADLGRVNARVADVGGRVGALDDAAALAEHGVDVALGKTRFLDAHTLACRRWPAVDREVCPAGHRQLAGRAGDPRLGRGRRADQRGRLPPRPAPGAAGRGRRAGRRGAGPGPGPSGQRGHRADPGSRAVTAGGPGTCRVADRAVRGRGDRPRDSREGDRDPPGRRGVGGDGRRPARAAGGPDPRRHRPPAQRGRPGSGRHRGGPRAGWGPGRRPAAHQRRAHPCRGRRDRRPGVHALRRLPGRPRGPQHRRAGVASVRPRRGAGGDIHRPGDRPRRAGRERLARQRDGVRRRALALRPARADADRRRPGWSRSWLAATGGFSAPAWPGTTPANSSTSSPWP